jgi:hypothetical protein
MEINITDATGKQPRKIGFLANSPVNPNFQEPTAFKFVVGKIPEVTYFCQSANIPGISIEAKGLDTPFVPLMQPGGKISHEQLSIKFLVSEGLYNWLEIYRWIRSLGQYKDYTETIPLNRGLVSDGALYVLSSKNNLQLIVRFSGLFPLSLTSVEFDYGDTELQAPSATVNFSFTDYEVANV